MTLSAGSLAMNLRLIFALAAFLGVAACGDANAPANSARTAIAKPGATPAPTQTAATAPTAGCPKAPAPKCPTATRAKTSKAATARRHRAAKRVVVAERRTGEARSFHRHHEHRATADGLPKRPYRYDQLPRDRYDEPPVGLDDGDQLARRSWRERSHSYREGRVYEDEHSDRRRHGHHHGEAYASRSERSYSVEESETTTERAQVAGPCCAPARPQAAGFDANGFLTWPGKVPARP